MNGTTLARASAPGGDVHCSTWDLPPEESVDVYTLVVEDGEWFIDDIEFAETTSDDCF